ncbi:alpha/beta hydrolase [Lactiplantibacillus paraplantarum]|uniref:alpha/beta hydrolase n=1 Tax=Lactiplantibacillus paraplantarum TaxID=60520 RepID=UPI0021A31C0C|nr:alpha/beta hydrolase [Lactiplantibacillus paraplantarum]MCT4458483.1 alpha/beta hydrolase [Lactiplantibacillus paraplantarum]
MQVINQKLTDTGAQLTGYLHQPDTNAHQTTLPAIIIVPGGSYTHIPVAQAESLAMAFAGHGYQAFYLEYTLLSDQQPLELTPVLDLGRAVSLLRQHAAEWHIDSQQIIPAGFSVGGHIVALYNDYWATSVATTLQTAPATLKPNNVLLSYPVISPLLGFPKDAATLATWSQTPTELAAEQHVNANNQPTFIWTTADDPIVPATNTLAYVNALATAQTPYELHVFKHGPHGLALANSQTAWKPDADQPHVAHWLTLALEWLADNR